MKKNQKPLVYAAVALALIFGGFLLQKIMTFVGVVLLALAGYYLYKNKR